MFPKTKRWTSEKYLAWIRKQPCIICGIPGAEPHHLKGAGGMSGTGMKAPDWATMPLCHPCHRMMHEVPAVWPDQWEYIARTLGRAINEGQLK